MEDRQIPPVPTDRAPRLARWFTPIGPPHTEAVAAGEARVVSVPGRYCVTHVIEGPDHLVVVDVGSRADIARIEPVVKWLGKPVGLVVPSHLHFDHIMGIDAAALHFGAELGLGQVARMHVEAGRKLRPVSNFTLRLWMRVWLWQGLPVFYPGDMPRGLGFGFPWSRNRFTAPLGPMLTDGEPLPGCPAWRVLETPGHADDAICLHHAEAGLLVAGDTVRNYQGGEWNELLTDPAAYENTKERLRALHVRAVFPGHGPNLFGSGSLWRA